MSTTPEGGAPAANPQRGVLERALEAVKDLRGRLEDVEAGAREPIAVVGLACRFPGGADDAESFWRLLREGGDAIVEVPASRWDLDACFDPRPEVPGKMYTRSGGFLDAVDGFDAAFFGISPREALRMDPQHRLLLEVAWEALEDAGHTAEALEGSAAGVFVGISTTDYAQRLRRAGFADLGPYDATGNSLNAAAGRLSYVLGLRGPCLAVDAACASSLVAVHLACQSLRVRECDLALAGGVNLILGPDAHIAMCRARALSPDGRCKTFDAGADGYGRGEGCGVVVLKRLADAVAQGDRILALLLGSAVHHDGRSSGLTVPNGPAQQGVIRAALAKAGIEPRDVGYVEAHGTGTSLGDPIEVRALAAVLGPGRPADRPLVLGSVKTNIGHLESAAGVAGLIKTVLAVRRGEIPPHLHLRAVNPEIDLAAIPAVIPAAPMAWPGPGRVAGVSAFGLSGTIAHVVVGQAPAEVMQEASGQGPWVVPVSGRSEEALRELARRYADAVQAQDAPGLEAFAYTASVRRTHHEHRGVAVGHTGEELAQRLRALAQGEKTPGVARGVAMQGVRKKLAFVFPGQGGQWPGMARDLARRETVFRETLERCELALGGFLEGPLADVLDSAELGEEGRIEVVQPALFAVQVALAELWKSLGVEPDAVAGHSMGEVAAACVAGALSLEDGARVIGLRSRLMSRLKGRGAMAMVELPLEQAREEVARGGGRVAVAASNGPRTTVLSGERAALDGLLEELGRRDVFWRWIKVDVASHSPQVEELREELMEGLKDLRPRRGEVPFYSTVRGERISGEECGAGYWVSNLRQAVLFAPVVGRLLAEGYGSFVELSPHPTLTLSVEEALREHGGGVVVPSLRREEEGREVLLGSLGALWAGGHPVEWARLHPQGGNCVSLPRYPWQHERFWFAPHGTGQRARAGGHPLLGTGTALADDPGHRVWEADFDLERLAFLSDHRVQGAAVLPGAGYVEMALAAGREALGESGLVLEDVAFERLLFLPETGGRSVQSSLRKEASGARSLFAVHSRPAGEGAEGAWMRHAQARLRPGGGAPPLREPLDEIRDRCREETPSDRFYADFEARGNLWGPLFQGISRLWRGPREALAELRPPEALQAELGRYRIHPALLDACLQVLGATVPVSATGEAQAFVPVGVDRVVFHRSPGGRDLWSHARLRDGAMQSAATFLGDVRLLDGEGNAVLEFLGLHGRGLDLGEVQAAATSLESCFYELQWKPKERPAAEETAEATLPGGAWLVFADRGGAGDALARSLRAAGRPVLLVQAAAEPVVIAGGLQIRPGCAADVRALLARSEVAAGLAGIVHLWSLDSPGGAALDLPALHQAQVAGCESVLTIVQQLGGLSPRLWLVTRGAQAVISGVPGEAPALAQAPLWGLGRTLAVEHPGLWGGLVDLDAADTAEAGAAQLLRELRGPRDEDQIAFRRGRRLVARLGRKSTAPPPPLAIRPDGAYLVTGGLGGLGLLVAQRLVDRGARNVVLLGRTPPPDHAPALRALEAAGAQVRVITADVADEGAMSEALAALRTEGVRLRGVVHAAGVVELATLQELDAPGLHAMLRPKVQGSLVLHRLLAGEELDFFVLFSSLAAVLGSPLLGAYAAGNAFLDALGHHRRAQGLPAVSMAWGFWAEAGMATRFQEQEGRRRSPAQGMGVLTAERGLDAFERLLTDESGHVGVLPIDWGEWLAAHPEAADQPLLEEVAREARPASGRTGRRAPELSCERLRSLPPGARPARLEGYLRRQVARVLRRPEPGVELDRPLSEMGLDSLMAVELRNGVEADLQVTVPMVRFLQGPSVRGLAGQILELAAARLAATSADAAAAETRVEALLPDPAHRDEPFPLNDIQEAYWIGRSGALELGGVAAHMYLETEARELDPARLSRAWRRLVERHGMLRAVIQPDGRQRVLAAVPPYEIPVIDLSGTPPPRATAALGRLREEMSHQVLPADRWPLFDIRMTRLPGGRVRLHLSLDILIADVWSWQVLFREWAELYRDPRAVLPPLELTFRDYILAERAARSSAAYQRDLDYWQGRLSALPPAPELPLAAPPATLGTPGFERRSSRLAAETWAGLKTRGTRAGLTASGLLLAAFSEVLAAWSKSPRFTLNVTLFNRLPLHPEVNRIVGDFTSVNLLAVDAATGDSSFESRAQRLQRQLWEDLEHSRVSGVRVIRDLTRAQGGSPRPVAPVVFTSTLSTTQTRGEEALPVAWLGELVASISQTPQVWIDHQVFEDRGALVFNWDSVRGLFPAGLLDDMFGAYCALLARLAAEEARWTQVERAFLPPDQQACRAAVNATVAPVPAGLLHGPFLAQAGREPGRIAVVSGETRITYGELLRSARRLGRRLRAAGARPNALVAVVMEKGWEQVAAVLGVLEAGAAYLPLDPAMPPERLGQLLALGEVTLALTQPWLDGCLDWPAGIERLLVSEEDVPASDEAPLAPAAGPEDLAYVIYTSGSTGVPKGVMIDHRGALNTVIDVNERFGVHAGDRVLALSSLSFDLSVYDVFGLLAAGGTVVLPEASVARDPAAWADLLRREEVTVWNSVPALMKLLVEHAAGHAEELPPSLRLVLLSGDWIPVGLPGQIRALRPHLPGIPDLDLISLGGATEASIWSILYPIESVAATWKSIPYGRPMKNQTFHVLDEGLEPSPDQVPGQLFIGGTGLAGGYWRAPDITGRSFFTHPRTGERLYRTGDLGRSLPGGDIEFLGREDFQVKVQGFRIELGEIETALLRHPQVRTAVVAAWGEAQGEKKLVGYVVPAPGESPAPAELRGFLRGKLPEYMVPAVFVTLDALPLSSNGKVDRKALPAPAAPPRPAAGARPADAALLARAADVVSRVLQLGDIDPDANLFDLGATSVDAIRIANALEHELGVRPRLEVVYQQPTLRAMVRSLEEQGAPVLMTAALQEVVS